MKHIRHMHPTIELCKTCAGTGTSYKYHEDDKLRQEPTAIVCTTCEGSGRVIVSKITQITIEPFKNK